MTDAPPPAATAATDPPTTTPPPPPPTRIGSAERQQAMDALDVHMSAGRLDPDEYGDRVGRASIARTTADLEPLFVDLPPPHAGPPAAVTASGWGSGSRPTASTPPSTTSAPTPAWSSPVSPGVEPAQQKHNGREPLGGRIGEVAVAVSPFVAVILFFATTHAWDEAWLFFLLIPLMGAVVYGRDWHDGDHHRDRRRPR